MQKIIFSYADSKIKKEVKNLQKLSPLNINKQETLNKITQCLGWRHYHEFNKEINKKNNKEVTLNLSILEEYDLKKIISNIINNIKKEFNIENIRTKDIYFINFLLNEKTNYIIYDLKNGIIKTTQKSQELESLEKEKSTYKIKNNKISDINFLSPYLFYNLISDYSDKNEHQDMIGIIFIKILYKFHLLKYPKGNSNYLRELFSLNKFILEANEIKKDYPNEVSKLLYSLNNIFSQVGNNEMFNKNILNNEKLLEQWGYSSMQYTQLIHLFVEEFDIKNIENLKNNGYSLEEITNILNTFNDSENDNICPLEINHIILKLDDSNYSKINQKILNSLTYSTNKFHNKCENKYKIKEVFDKKTLGIISGCPNEMKIHTINELYKNNINLYVGHKSYYDKYFKNNIKNNIKNDFLNNEIQYDIKCIFLKIIESLNNTKNSYEYVIIDSFSSIDIDLINFSKLLNLAKNKNIKIIINTQINLKHKLQQEVKDFISGILIFDEYRLTQYNPYENKEIDVISHFNFSLNSNYKHLLYLNDKPSNNYFVIK
jgi:hypothetical protein